MIQVSSSLNLQTIEEKLTDFLALHSQHRQRQLVDEYREEEAVGNPILHGHGLLRDESLKL